MRGAQIRCLTFVCTDIYYVVWGTLETRRCQIFCMTVVDSQNSSANYGFSYLCVDALLCGAIGTLVVLLWLLPTACCPIPRSILGSCVTRAPFGINYPLRSRRVATMPLLEASGNIVHGGESQHVDYCSNSWTTTLHAPFNVK